MDPQTGVRTGFPLLNLAEILWGVEGLPQNSHAQAVLAYLISWISTYWAPGLSSSLLVDLSVICMKTEITWFNLSLIPKHIKLFVTSGSLWTGRSQTYWSANSFWFEIPIRSTSGISVPLFCKITIPEKCSPRYIAVSCVEWGVIYGCIALVVMEKGLHMHVYPGEGAAWAGISARASLPFSTKPTLIFWRIRRAIGTSWSPLLLLHYLPGCKLHPLAFLPWIRLLWPGKKYEFFTNRWVLCTCRSKRPTGSPLTLYFIKVGLSHLES